MKKQLTIVLALFFVSTTITSNAQIAGIQGSDPAFGLVKIQQGKKVSEVDVLTTIQNKFQNQFANVKWESWTKTSDGYAIRFSKDEMDNLIFYDSKANISGRVRYYKANFLPFDIRLQVESDYYNYDILSVQEITVEKSVTYLVSIAAKNEWKIIRVSEAGMDVYKEYRRG